MTPLEINFPNKNPMILFPGSLISIVFQPKNGLRVHRDTIIIGITGWGKPYTYEGDDAQKIYNKIKSHFDTTVLDFDS